MALPNFFRFLKVLNRKKNLFPWNAGKITCFTTLSSLKAFHILDLGLQLVIFVSLSLWFQSMISFVFLKLKEEFGSSTISEFFSLFLGAVISKNKNWWYQYNLTQARNSDTDLTDIAPFRSLELLWMQGMNSPWKLVRLVIKILLIKNLLSRYQTVFWKKKNIIFLDV